MAEMTQISIEDFLKQLDLDKVIADAEKLESTARINRKGAGRIDRQSTARIDRYHTASIFPVDTEGVETRRQPTPTEIILIERLKETVIQLDVDKLYVAFAALCQTDALHTNYTILWEGKNLSVRDFYIKIWIRTVELAKMVGSYKVNEPGSNWKIWNEYFPEVKPLIDQANAEFLALGQGE